MREVERYAASRSADPGQVAAARTTLEENRQALATMWQRYRDSEQEYQHRKERFQQQAGEYQRRERELAHQFTFTVTLQDGRKKQATLYRISDRYDLALLKVGGMETPWLEPYTGPPLAIGSPVYAIGSPLGLRGSVTSGILSSRRQGYLQTNAEIYPGNSGGPLVTEDGRVIGVNTMKKITEKFEGLGFAIPIETVLTEFRDYLR